MTESDRRFNFLANPTDLENENSDLKMLLWLLLSSVQKRGEDHGIEITREDAENYDERKAVLTIYRDDNEIWGEPWITFKATEKQ